MGSPRGVCDIQLTYVQLNEMRAGVYIRPMRHIEIFSNDMNETIIFKINIIEYSVLIARSNKWHNT